MRRATVVVMAKAPQLGAGKTRLAAGVGPVEALRINRFMLARTLLAAHDPRWDTALAVAPDRMTGACLPVVGRGGRRIGQGGGGLGERLARLYGRAWPGPLAVIGTDCPTVHAGALAATLGLLRRAPFVLGPTADGGFWIFAARSPRAAVAAFAGVRWSTPHALADLAARLPGPAATGPALDDVDTLADWRAYQQGVRSAGRCGCRRA